MSVIRDYQQSFKNRGRNSPPGSSPDLSEGPRRYTVRPGYPETPLPTGTRLNEALSLSKATNSVSLAQLAYLFLCANGLLARKLTVNWTHAASMLSADIAAQYGRGTPSGGALYPVDIYLVADQVADLNDGIYQYCETRSTLLQLHKGRFGAAVAEGWGGRHRPQVSYVVLALKFFRTAYKYQNLAYHLMIEDCGAMVASLSHAAAAMGLRCHVRYRFVDDIYINLLGLNSQDDAVMFLLELSTSTAIPLAAEKGGERLSTLAIQRMHDENAQGQLTLVSQLNLATVIGSFVEIESPLNLTKASELRATHLLPPPATIDIDIGVFMNRTSSMGAQDNSRALEPEMLSALLNISFSPYSSDLTNSPSGPNSVRLVLWARNVRTIPPNTYAYLPEQHGLAPISEDTMSVPDLQKAYFSDNYNLHQASLVIVLVARQADIHREMGERSIRVCNSEAGLIAQRLSLVASRFNLACGVLLGFDSSYIDTLFSLARDSESAILVAVISAAPPRQAKFDCRFDG